VVYRRDVSVLIDDDRDEDDPGAERNNGRPKGEEGGEEDEMVVMTVPTTLGDLLASWLPDLFRVRPEEENGDGEGEESLTAAATSAAAGESSVSAKGSVSPSSGKRGSAPAEASATSKKKLTTTTKTIVQPRLPSSELEWRISGLSNLPLEIPLYPLWTDLSHPDQFLYVCVVVAPTTSAASTAATAS
jgi:hypothetical protein